MKKILLNTLLSTSLLASVTPLIVTTACSGKGEQISEDYVPDLCYQPSATELVYGVTKDEALNIFLNAQNNDKIWLQDCKYLAALQISEAKAHHYSISIRLNLSNIKIDKTNKTINFSMYWAGSQKALEGAEESVDCEFEMNITASNLPLACDYWDSFTVHIDTEREHWSTDANIKGTISGYVIDETVQKNFTGKQRTIDKNTDLSSGSEAEGYFDDVEIFMNCVDFTGVQYYLKNLKQRSA